MKILVTGGFGFIGTHLVEQLLEQGHNVHVVDNLSTSAVDLPAYLAQVKRAKDLTYVAASVEEFCSTRSNGAFDQIYHLASVVGPVGVLEYGGRLAQKIINDSQRVAALAKHCGAKLVEVSTSEVYGGGKNGYCTEDDFKVVQPRTSIRLEYAIGKLAAEIAVVNATNTSGLKASVVRPFNVAGPRQSGKGGFVLPRFIKQAIAGEPLTVYGDGSMIRAFTHVGDVAAGIILVMENGRNGCAYNIGNPVNKTTILELARRVLSVTKSKSEIIFVDPKTLFGPLFEEANDKYPDASRAMSELGWNPRFGLDDTIVDSFEYIRTGRVD